MSTLSQSLVSSSSRRLMLRKRPDLSAKRQRYQGRAYWIVKEPVGLNYFRFQEEEFAILQMIDGHTSLDEIKHRFEEEFPPQKITLEELQHFVGMLHRSGLIIADVPGQGYQLKKRRDERKRKELVSALTNVLAIRFKGFDPENLLDWMYPKLRWLFTKTFVISSLLLAAAALLLILVQWDTFQNKLPEFHNFFSVRNAFWLMIALAVSKVIHEFGHGLTCKHFGGECHEIGVLILVLTPCLYCNVSDSWMLPNKWHRAAIGAAGMWVEIVMAGIATFVWWFSEPGMLHMLALSTMFVCSVSTVVFNGNPLLRYDGYYILSDIMEIPNLRQKSSSILSRKMGEWCLGIEPPEDPFLPQRNQALFAFYTVAAVAYRWFVVISILFFLHKVFEPYGLKIIGSLIAMMSLYGLLVQPFWKLYKYLTVPGRLSKVKKKNVFATAGVVAAVLAFVIFVPLPYHVNAALEIKPRGAASVYVTNPGTLKEVYVEPGQRVSAGQEIARLENIDTAVELASLESRCDRASMQLQTLLQRQLLDPTVMSQLQPVRETWETATQQLKHKQREEQRLTLKAPTDGVVLPAPRIPERPAEEAGTLPTWHGTPFERRNRGAFLEPGVLFCQVGDPQAWEAQLVIDQSDAPFVTRGQKVEMKLDQLVRETLEGEIAEISTRELQVTPRQLSNRAGGEVAAMPDEAGIERPLSAAYHARVPLEDNDGLLRVGLRGTAKIHAGHRTLGQRLARLLARTFRFSL